MQKRILTVTLTLCAILLVIGLLPVHGEAEIYYFSSHAKKSYTEVEYPSGVYIMFGKESCGLPEKLVEDNIERALRIPMRGSARCLNLSNAVAVVTYEILRRWDFEGLS